MAKKDKQKVKSFRIIGLDSECVCVDLEAEMSESLKRFLCALLLFSCYNTTTAKHNISLIYLNPSNKIRIEAGA